MQRIRDEAQLVTQKVVQEIRDMGHELLQRTAGHESRLDSGEMSHGKLSRMGETLGFSSVQTLSSVEQQATHGECHRQGNAQLRHSDHGVRYKFKCLTRYTAIENSVRTVMQNAHRVGFCQNPATEPREGTISTQGTETECLGNSDIDAIDVEGESGGRREPSRFRDTSDLWALQSWKSP